MKGKYIAILAVFVFVVFFFSIGARAADWKPYGPATNGSSYYDSQSIRRVSKDIVRVWTKGPYQLPPGLVSLKLIYSISLVEYNCSEKKFCFLSITHYNQGGDVTGSIPINSDFPSWNFIVPESMEELLFNIVCGGR